MTEDKRLLVLDIDGTLLNDGKPTAGLPTLRMILSEYRAKISVVYATGRSFPSSWSLISSDILPEPDGIAAFVGTEAWLPPWDKPNSSFKNTVSTGWNRTKVCEAAKLFPELREQPACFQSSLKASYLVRTKSTVTAFKNKIKELGVSARVVYSQKKYLDVLPERSGKRNAVRFIRHVLGADHCIVLACGDSGNDLDLLWDSNFLGVAVGNAEAKLHAIAPNKTLYGAGLPFAAGVLEGAEAFHFWPTR